MRKLATSIGICAALMTSATITPVSAHEARSTMSYSSDNSQCEVALNYDITVAPKLLAISDDGVEVYRIEMGKLYVQGELVTLDARQQQVLTQYSGQVANQVPQVIALVHDAVDIASTAASMALAPLLGDTTAAKLDEMMDGLELRIQKLAYQDGDKYFLASTQSSLEDAFGEEFEQEVEQLVKNSIGSIMINLGSEMIAADGDSFEQRMESFGQKMESVGQEIELQMKAQSQALEARTDKICDNFQDLIALEQKLRIAVPELDQYPLIDAAKIELLE